MDLVFPFPRNTPPYTKPMSIGTPITPPWLLLLTIILLSTPPLSSSVPIPTTSFHSFLSLSHSLLSRVAKLRAARGDISGSLRVKSIAEKIEKHNLGCSFYGSILSVDWDYFKNYAWRDLRTASFEMYDAGNELMNELTWLESEVDWVERVRQNYTVLSILSRVANLLAAPSESIAEEKEKHNRGFSFYGVILPFGWDYFKNYAWRHLRTAWFEMYGGVIDMNKWMNESTRLESQVDRVEWVRQTVLSLSHGLSRVANLLAARGDISGSIGVRSIAEKIQKHIHGDGCSFYGFILSVGWDYFKNYAWRDLKTASSEVYGAVTDMNELLRDLNELTRLDSQVDRVEWVRQHYSVVLKLLKSLFNRLLKVFNQPGPLKDAIEMVKTEIVDGGLLRDCLQLGSTDLKGLIQILIDFTSQYSSSSVKTEL